MRILVLGGGLVGSAIARDLAADTSFKVSVADVNEDVVAQARMYDSRGVYANLARPTPCASSPARPSRHPSCSLRRRIHRPLGSWHPRGLQHRRLPQPRAHHAAPDMKEKTLRYPGHAELMWMLCDTSNFSKQEINVRGTRVRPVDVTAQLLFPAWKLQAGEADVSIMRVVIEGERARVREKRVYTLVDHNDAATRTTAMARTTGYNCAVAARLVSDGTFTRKGVPRPSTSASMPRGMQRSCRDSTTEGNL